MNHLLIYFETSALLASIIAWPYLRQSKALRLFPLLLILIVAGELYGAFITAPLHKNNAWIYNLQVPLQYIIYIFILYNAFQNKITKRLMLVFIGVMALITAATTSYYSQKGMFDVYSYSAGSIFLIIAIVLKFYEMLKSPIEFNFLKSPFFYMLFAFLLFNVGTLPYFTMSNWLYFTAGYKSAVTVLANVMSILNYILYSTYIICFVWIIRMKAF